jgi:hypothetical protein
MSDFLSTQIRRIANPKPSPCQSLIHPRRPQYTSRSTPPEKKRSDLEKVRNSRDAGRALDSANLRRHQDHPHLSFDDAKRPIGLAASRRAHLQRRQRTLRSSSPVTTATGFDNSSVNFVFAGRALDSAKRPFDLAASPPAHLQSRRDPQQPSALLASLLYSASAAAAAAGKFPAATPCGRSRISDEPWFQRRT